MSSLDSDLAEPAEPISEETRRAALRTVCRHALSKDDALALAQMLDLLAEPEPAQDIPRKRTPAPIFNPGNCVTCGQAMNPSNAAPEKGLRYGSRGRCTRCYAALRRARKRGKA